MKKKTTNICVFFSVKIPKSEGEKKSIQHGLMKSAMKHGLKVVPGGYFFEVKVQTVKLMGGR